LNYPIIDNKVNLATYKYGQIFEIKDIKYIRRYQGVFKLTFRKAVIVTRSGNYIICGNLYNDKQMNLLDYLIESKSIEVRKRKSILGLLITMED